MDKIPIVIREKKRIEEMAKNVTHIAYMLEESFKPYDLFKNKKNIQKIYLIMLYILNNSIRLSIPTYDYVESKNKWKDFLSLYLDKNDIDYYFQGKCPNISNQLFEKLYESITQLVLQEDFDDIIFYVLECFEYLDQNQSSKKKKEGIYYTPSDVVEYITCQTIDKYFQMEFFEIKEKDEQIQILDKFRVGDISCGTGVFLSKSVDKLLIYYSKLDINNEQALKMIFEKNIYGLDISDKAIDTTIMLLIIKYSSIIVMSNLRFYEYYNSLKNNICQGNALKQENEVQLNCIIGNPPYSYNLENHDFMKKYVSYTNTSSDKSYLFFIENLIRLTNEKSISGLVVPLSISYNTSKAFKNVRKLISQDKAEWDFAFFDRSPDSIFGDDIKTRAAIVFRNSYVNYNSIKTTKLMRWNSQDRNLLFKNINFVYLKSDLENGIFKLGNSQLGGIYELFEQNLGKFSKSIGKGNSSIFYYPVAYNWMSLFLEEPLAYDMNNKIVLSSAKVLYSEENKYLIYALLCSTITFWLWIGKGDAFHVSKTFINDLPYDLLIFSENDKAKLIDNGKLLWNEVQKFKIESNNAGKKTINYSYICCYPIIEKINSIVILAMGIPDWFGIYLKQWYFEMISVGRKSFKYDTIVKKVMEEI